MANQYGIDMGNVLSTVESVKNSRQARQNNDTKMDWAKEDRDIARQRSKTLNVLRSEASTGDQAAVSALVSFDPKEAEKVISSIKGMDDMQRKQVKDNVDQIGRMSAFVLQAEDPESAYQLVMQNLPEETRQGMPENFDPNFVQMQLAKAKELDQLLDNPEKITVGKTDMLYKDGKLIDKAATAPKSGSGSKASDESLMYKQAAELLGGIFDQQGNLQNLDPNVRSNVQAITSEAARLFDAGGISRSDAVTQAARKQGVDIKNLGNTGTVDRNQLLNQYLNK